MLAKIETNKLQDDKGFRCMNRRIKKKEVDENTLHWTSFFMF